MGGDERGLLGRLRHHRVAGRQGRRDLAGEDGEREVPGADAGEGSERWAVETGGPGGVWPARAAANIDDAALEELSLIHDELADAYAVDDGDRAVRLNHEFHRAINVAADSPKLAQLMSQITRYAPESVFPTIAGWPARSVADHAGILAALRAHDAEAARAAMSDHLAAGATPLIEHLVSRGVAQKAT